MLERALIVFGTRPEAIKMAPLVLELRRRNSVDIHVCVSGQHRGMLDQVLELFEIKPDHDLDIMRPDQGLGDVTARVMNGIGEVIRAVKPTMIFVHGDTTTAMAASLAGFYERVPVAHVEAGLRSGDLDRPWPEEMNRRFIDLIADVMFVPTERARQNLLTEGRDPSRIFVTGNTGIDALLMMQRRIEREPALARHLAARHPYVDPNRRLIVVTGHRRENFGSGLEGICHALHRLCGRGDVDIVYPVHPNPNVQRQIRSRLGGLDGVHLVEPLEYLDFVYLMQRSSILLTDSGGIQEEGPALGKPVVVMRDVTERPEAVEAGTVHLVGTDCDRITDTVSRLLDDEDFYRNSSRRHSPYGDGTAAFQIAERLSHAI